MSYVPYLDQLRHDSPQAVLHQPMALYSAKATFTFHPTIEHALKDAVAYIGADNPGVFLLLNMVGKINVDKGI